MSQSLDPEINKEQTTDGELNTSAENVMSPAEKASDKNQPVNTKEGILERLKDFAAPDANVPPRAEVESLKQAYHKLRIQELEEQKAKYVADGNEDADFTPAPDPKDDVLKTYLGEIKAKRAKQATEEEKQKEENYNKKLQIIESIKILTESTDDFNKLYNDFKELQQKWNDIKQVPASKEKALWADYQKYNEVFYDLIKINNEFRDYDFKKNLELKTVICETAEKLTEEEDSVSAFHQLQNLHQQWREIGPVAKELRDEIWERFKNASTTINKNYQEHFESLKSKEEENLAKKQAICEKLKAIDYTTLASMKNWDKKSKEVIDLQAEWKTIGFVPRKYNNQIFEEFRALCDTFFEKKSEFFKGIKEDMDVNLEKKRSLCEKANALKDSTDWKKTTDEMIAIQKEWKTIGPVPRKYSDAIWKEFVTACDYFFEQKKINTSSQNEEEEANLHAKRDIIEKIKNIDQSQDTDKVLAEVRKLVEEFHAIGFVPFREKDKIYKQFREAVDAHYDRFKIDKAERRLDAFRSNLEDLSKDGEGAKRKLYNERDRLIHTYNKLKSDLQTYENNMSFLSLSSKGASGLLKDVHNKVQGLKDEMELIEKKIATIDENLNTL